MCCREVDLEKYYFQVPVVYPRWSSSVGETTQLEQHQQGLGFVVSFLFFFSSFYRHFSSAFKLLLWA